jgi:arabinogalactan endo-1,4-beta-galactosidase
MTLNSRSQVMSRVALTIGALAVALSGCAGSDDAGPQSTAGNSAAPGGSAGVSGSAGSAVSGFGSSGIPGAGAPSAGATNVAGADAGGDSAGGASSMAGAAGATMSMAGAAGSTGPFPFNPSYILGADISWTLEDEAGGAKYADANGVKPIEQILVDNGFNYVRLRTFVCPSCAGGYNRQGFCDDKHTVIMAKRVKACGMGLFLDFHMSDTWVSLGTGASTSAQPSAWKGMTPSEMQAAAYQYTNRVVKELADAGVTPDMVQIGNETNAGMSGIPISNWTDLSALIAAGIKGVRDVNPKIQIWVQNGRPRPDSAGGSNFTGWVDTYLGSKGTKLDIDGVCGSTYGTTNAGADWIESFSYILNKYKLPVLSCEYTVAAPDDKAGQLINTKVMRGFANQMGRGSFIWEPTRYPGVNQNTLFTKSGNTYTTNAAMNSYPALAKSYGLPVPSGQCK